MMFVPSRRKTRKSAPRKMGSAESGTEDPAAQARSVTTSLPDDAWVCENYARIHRAAWLMTGDKWEAEDLAQETFVVAIDRWSRFDGRSSRSTWLFGILVRLNRRRARSLARLRRRVQEYISRKDDDQVLDPRTALAHQQWRESVWASVAKLPEPQRVAVVLRFAEEMTYQQIGEALGCAEGTAKSRVHHGLKRLRQNSQEENIVTAPPTMQTLTAK